MRVRVWTRHLLQDGGAHEPALVYDVDDAGGAASVHRRDAGCRQGQMASHGLCGHRRRKEGRICGVCCPFLRLVGSLESAFVVPCANAGRSTAVTTASLTRSSPQADVLSDSRRVFPTCVQEPKPDSPLAQVAKDVEQQAQATEVAAEEKQVIEEDTAKIDELEAEKQVRSGVAPAVARQETRLPFASHGRLQSCAILRFKWFH